jgi:hypothetical protein
MVKNVQKIFNDVGLFAAKKNLAINFLRKIIDIFNKIITFAYELNL